MATKNNHSSLRYSDEVAKIIESEPGKTFNEKFDNLIKHCHKELPKIDTEIRQKKSMLKQVERDIDRKRAELYQICGEIRKMTDIQSMAQSINKQLDRIQAACSEVLTEDKIG